MCVYVCMCIGVQANNEPASKMTMEGSPTCNLLEHRVTAGCTAVVALRVGRTLYVANAGDSRGVLCRAGKAVALSEDHKPQSDVELERITKVRCTFKTCPIASYTLYHIILGLTHFHGLYTCIYIYFFFFIHSNMIRWAAS